MLLNDQMIFFPHLSTFLVLPTLSHLISTISSILINIYGGSSFIIYFPNGKTLLSSFPRPHPAGPRYRPPLPPLVGAQCIQIFQGLCSHSKKEWGANCAENLVKFKIKIEEDPLPRIPHAGQAGRQAGSPPSLLIWRVVRGHLFVTGISY